MLGKFIVTGVTFGVFMTEAIIHYNMGQAKSRQDNGEDSGERLHFHLPPARELAKIAAVTGTFSVLSGVLINTLSKKFPPNA
jgi:hypothetical protein